MASSITRQEIEEMKEFLRRHPIDPQYDEAAETLDALIPPEESRARIYREMLRRLGELDSLPQEKDSN